MMHVDPAYRFSEDHEYGFIEEPTNPHDSDAIMVVRKDQEDRHVGYVGREFAKHVKPILQHGNLISVKYDPEKSNAYRRILHLNYESPALCEERRLANTLRRQLVSSIETDTAPLSISSPKKRRKSVTFAGDIDVITQ